MSFLDIESRCLRMEEDDIPGGGSKKDTKQRPVIVVTDDKEKAAQFLGVTRAFMDNPTIMEAILQGRSININYYVEDSDVVVTDLKVGKPRLSTSRRQS